MKSLTLSAPVSMNSTTTALLSTVLVLVRGFSWEQGGSGVATRSSRIALACNPSAREAEQQDRVPSLRRLHRQALPLKQCQQTQRQQKVHPPTFRTRRHKSLSQEQPQDWT